MNQEEPFSVQFTTTARRHLDEQPPEAIAFASYEFICGPCSRTRTEKGSR